MRTTIARLAIAGLAMTAVAPTFAQSAAQEAAESWLLRSCDLEPDAAAGALRAETTAVTELLLEAYRSGPPPKLVEQVQQAALIRFSRRAFVLARSDGAGLSPRDVKRIGQVGREEFVSRAVESFEVGYRTQALRGLVMLQPHVAHSILSREASNERSPLRNAARSLLRRSPAPDGTP